VRQDYDLRADATSPNKHPTFDKVFDGTPSGWARHSEPLIEIDLISIRLPARSHPTQ
jgi:hypothetical protein